MIIRLQGSSAVKAPYQDLCFLKTLEGYEKVDKVISQAALSKFCQQLWYLSGEIAALSLFYDAVDEETKVRIVANLERECLFDLQKKDFPTKDEISRSLYGKPHQLFCYSILFTDQYSHIEINLIFYLLQKKIWMGLCPLKARICFHD